MELLRLLVEFLRLVVEFLRLMCRGGCCGVADACSTLKFCIGPSKDQFVYESSKLGILISCRTDQCTKSHQMLRTSLFGPMDVEQMCRFESMIGKDTS